MITVLGATGKTGRTAVAHLRDAGVPVRAVARSKDKLLDLVKRGAQAHAGDLTDREFLARAFDGARGVYALVPLDFAQPDILGYGDRMGEATVRALEQAAVPHVVFLSSIGADQDKTGPITAVYRQERRLAELPHTHVLSLRPGSFYENHFMSAGTIQARGMNAGALRGDLPVVQLSAADIGVYAGKVLERLDFSGKGYRELHGPRPLSAAEATRILGEKLGKPGVPYLTLSSDAALEGMLQAGLPRGLALLVNELAESFNSGRAKSLDGPTPDTTLPTTFEDFAEGLARTVAPRS